MAIDFINSSIVSAGRAESAVGLGAYLVRGKWRDPLTGRLYDFSNHAGDLLAAEVLLPEHADPALAEPEALVAAMEAAELVVERKTKRQRLRENAQLARHVIVALPKELSARQRLDLAREWARAQYVDQGAAVLLATHEAEDPETGNYHAHYLVSTRTAEKTGFSRRKARHLNPDFSRGKGHAKGTLHKDDLPGQWRAFQNAYFRRHDIPLSVDPSFVVAGRHLGKARFLGDSAVATEDAAARAEAQRRIREIPELLDFATRQAATFTRGSLVAVLKKHDVPKAEIGEIVARALADPEVIRLADPSSGRPCPRFTTRTVRTQERQILELARNMADRVPGRKKLERRKAKAAEVARRLGLADEQLEALMHCMAGGDLTLIRGVAGAGKSYTVRGIREVLEASGYRVVGLAPTNKVAVTMAVDGFGHAATLDLELLRQEGGRKGTLPWDARTCIVVDEAGMVNSALLERVLQRAATAGAKVILVGDQAQLASVARGGMFGVLKDQLGCAEIREIRRQEEDWAKAASLDFAEGNIEVGLAAYAERGHLTFDDTLEDAMDALVRQWSADFARAPGVERFVYAATNKSVNRLNEALQAARWSGQKKAFTTFATERGEVELTVGDRIQIYGNHRKDGIFNGMVGTVTEATPDRIVFVADGGTELYFCPEDFNQFGLGYAGTVYRGQGQTLPQTYALYDSVFSWNRRTTYVALTRHKQAVNLFVPRDLAPDLAALGRQMGRADDGDASLAWRAVGEPETAMASLPSAVQTSAPATRAQPGSSAKVLGVRSEIVVPPATKPAVTPVRELRRDQETSLPAGIVPALSTAGTAGQAGSGTPGQPATVIHAIPFATVLGGRTRHFDLQLDADRDALRQALRTEPMPVVVETYAAIRRIEPARKDAREVLQGLRASITHEAKTHGFLPKDNRVWAECLNHFRFDPWNVLPDPELRPERGEADIRTAVQPLLGDQPRIWSLFKERLAMLVPEALRNIYGSLLNAGARAAGNRKEDLRFAIINTAAFVYDVAYDLGIDLFPEETAERGRMATPDEFRDQILVLARKAERAGRPRFAEEEVAAIDAAPRLAPPERASPARATPATVRVDLYLEFLTRAFGKRLDGLIADCGTKIVALMAQQPRNFLQHHAVDDDLARAQAELGALQERRAMFDRSPATLLERARPIDFLPSRVTEEDLARSRVRSPHPGGPDPATIMLEELIRLKVWNVQHRAASAKAKSPKPAKAPVAAMIEAGSSAVRHKPQPAALRPRAKAGGPEL